MALKNTKRIRPISYNQEDKAFLENIGRKVNHLRTDKNLTQNELAVLSGLVVYKSLCKPSKVVC